MMMSVALGFWRGVGGGLTIRAGLVIDIVYRMLNGKGICEMN
jgi:hypothetical protein